MSLDQNAKNILFITSSRIGDAILSFGILDELCNRYPNAQFTIVCGPLVSSFFEGFPRLKCLIPLKKKKYSKHWFDLWKMVVRTNFDVVVDLRNSIVSRTIRAHKRHILGPSIDQSLHKVEQNAQVINALPVPAPRLWLSVQQMEKARALIPDGFPVLGIGPTANWAGKTWESNRFIDVVRWIIREDGLMPSARVAVFAAPGEEDDARKVLAAISPERAIDLIAKTDPATAAACLSRCTYYIGNDSGLMHCAAASGIPTFGLFGPSYPHIYHPWGAHTDFVATPESFEQLTDFEGYNPKTVGTLMNSLTVSAVQERIKKSWASMTHSS